ncbi:MAG: hypothetical protein HYZ54_00040 [Ignavibacteriae bacterium]|nr:hypothetical protein [Ignavibacteriota bacterium]
MINPMLNADNCILRDEYYNSEFEKILGKIITCYKCMIENNERLDDNENFIRDRMLYGYLKKQWFKVRYEVTNYLFDSELPEINLPEAKGRIDIRVMPVNPLVNDDAYYIIECKRLNSENINGSTGLNSEYINEGLFRFVSTKYSTYYKTNGMIGFVVHSLDIHNNVHSINQLLNSFSQANTIQNLQIRNIVQDFDCCYLSTHSIADKEITLYHLMLDFSSNIN